MSDEATTPQKDQAEYRVLARKYRPSTFGELIGQEAMVRTLTNAIDSGRLAHAFVMTGVRGIGKTTTARLIARALNCVGEDGNGGPTISPCGVCEHCKAIAGDRHVDVMELDAASRTGVDDIREIIEGVRYRPTSARYKIYIIDEVHMLSKSAFNALLKTLEEPPEHVKFIFATTEIRKIPVTVLSRCQRFDLRRVDQQTLADHFATIAVKENAQIAPEALTLIARAADGSVRDGLSLLDQAIAHCAGEVGEEQVRDMLGLADRAQTFDLLDLVFKGDIKGALASVAEQYKAGADPVVMLQDMLELVHWLTRLKVSPDAADSGMVSETEKVRGAEMAGALNMAALSRAWQMLLKGIQEANHAPSPLQAVEMILVRLAYATDLPSPADAVKALKDAAPATSHGTAASGGNGGGTGHSTSAMGSPLPSGPSGGGARPQAALAQPHYDEQPHMASDPQAAPQVMGAVEAMRADPQRFEDVVALANAHNERILHANLVSNVHLIEFAPGKIVFNPTEHAPSDLAQTLGKFLNSRTDRPWSVTTSEASGEATLHQKVEAAEAQKRHEAAEHPVVKAVLDAFPGAKIEKVRDLAPLNESDDPAGDNDA